MTTELVNHDEQDENRNSFISLAVSADALKSVLSSLHRSLFRHVRDTAVNWQQAKSWENVFEHVESDEDLREGALETRSGEGRDEVRSRDTGHIDSEERHCASSYQVSTFFRSAELLHDTARPIALSNTSTTMEPPPPRPKLSLKFKSNIIQAESNSQPQTPAAETPLRTPSIKLKLSSSTVATPSEDGGSTKKRKRDNPSADPEHAAVAQPKNKLTARLKLNTSVKPQTGKATIRTPGITLKTKGKIPKRPLGVGYDSELEDREQDPVILEGVILRMQPGPDCDYVRESIANGLVGVSVMQGGARITIRFFDVNGRRGILDVRNNQYAISTVDLPTITEGMKSWDRKNFIKSIDISQMILVLGRCRSEEEARNYPLPGDVDPKTYKYAHGLTAPMHNVRKRRFERTARARVDDIEAIERKVAAMIDADTRARNIEYATFDHDPREDEDSEQEDAEAEAEETDGYFPHVEDAEDAEEDDQDYTELEEMLAAEDQNDSGLQTGTQSADVSAAPSPTPEETPADADDDDDMDQDDDEDEGQSDAEEKSEKLAKVKEFEQKISEQRELLKKQSNNILKQKIAKRIMELEQDLKMQRRVAGIAEIDHDENSEEE